jgi:NADPH2:quinone reductase
MRAIVMHRVGGPEVLELQDVPAPVPGPGAVLVELHARGVNFADTEWRRARYRPTPLPWILGSEGAGVVVEIGAGVDPAWRGRRVALYAPPPTVSGTYAELATCPVEALLPLPDGLDFVTAAAVPAQGLTAHLLVHRAARIHDVPRRTADLALDLERVGDPCSYPFSVGFPAFFQPAMPCGMMYTLV